MVGVTNGGVAAERARWLAELAEALEDAGRVIGQLGDLWAGTDASDLYARIEAVQVEVQMMRLMRSSGAAGKSGPEWTNNSPWRLSA